MSAHMLARSARARLLRSLLSAIPAAGSFWKPARPHLWTRPYLTREMSWYPDTWPAGSPEAQPGTMRLAEVGESSGHVAPWLQVALLGQVPQQGSFRRVLWLVPCLQASERVLRSPSVGEPLEAEVAGAAAQGHELAEVTAEDVIGGVEGHRDGHDDRRGVVVFVDVQYREVDSVAAGGGKRSGVDRGGLVVPGVGPSGIP